MKKWHGTDKHVKDLERLLDSAERVNADSLDDAYFNGYAEGLRDAIKQLKGEDYE